MRLIVALCLLWLAALAPALTIELPPGGPYRAGFGTDVDAPGAVRTAGDVIELDTKGRAEGGYVYVLDEKTGRAAWTTVGKTGNIWNVGPEQFIRVGKLELRLTQGGASAPSAVVEAEGQSVLLDPSSEGKATLKMVPAKPFRVRVKYNRDGRSTSLTQIVDPAASPVEIALPGGAPAAAAAPPEAKESSAKAEEPKGQSANPVGSFVVTLVALGVVGGLAYFALRYYQRNSDDVNARLEKLGVQVPKAPDADLADADPVPDPSFPKAQKIEPIILGDAPVTAAPIATSPRLTTPDGSAFDLPDGETVVGREAGLGLAHPGESSVSRRHARFVRVGEAVTLENLGSTNGTYVNGQKVEAPRVLSPGDEVRFGAVVYRYGG